MKRNPANIAAATNFSQVFGQHEFVSECKLKPEQIALALLAGHVATQQQSIAQIGAMLREVLDAIATVDDRVDMVADRTWKSRYLILDAINKAKSQPQKRNRSLAKKASAAPAQAASLINKDGVRPVSCACDRAYASYPATHKPNQFRYLK